MSCWRCWRRSRWICAVCATAPFWRIGFAGGLRRSEIVGLDCGPDQSEDGTGWIEIFRLASRTPEALTELPGDDVRRAKAQ